VSSARLAARVFGSFEGGFFFERKLEGCYMSWYCATVRVALRGEALWKGGAVSEMGCYQNRNEMMID
jgi:hypothetical protein